MEPKTVVLSVALTYLVVCLAVGTLAARRTTASAQGYVAGDRSLGPVVMYFITGATIFSSFAFLGMPGWAYSRGAFALYVVGYGAIGFLPFYFLGPRALRVGREFGFVTQAEMVASRFRMPGLAGLMAVVSTIAFVPYIALQMQGAGMVLESVTEGAVPMRVGAALVYGVVLAYVLASGVLGVGWTNTLQGILMMILAWIMGLLLPDLLYGGVAPMFDRLAETRPELLRAPGLDAAGEPMHWGAYSSAILVSIVGFSFWPHLFMKAFGARDERTIRRTVVWFPTFQLFLVPLLLIGFAGVLYETPPPANDQILPHLLMNMDVAPVLVGLFCAGALAASMSSGDALVHASGSVLVRDGLVTCLGVSLEPERERRWIRIALVLVTAGSYVLAVKYTGSVGALLLHAYGPVTQFAPVVVATLCWRRATGAGVFAGLLVGIAVNVVLHLDGDLRPWPLHAGIYGLVANVSVLVVVSLATGGAARDGRFLDVASGRPAEDPTE